ncbi:20020_t:CDS:10 [Gigaspora margarita]|uniref:20020_t:CDS:1 n=1 Tax=Gigaspora margarita TaxID=4874 RepID=A0ABN7UWI5_GIGMA|nr:20020_t:CDS:10 [Gigaspora margarita]
MFGLLPAACCNPNGKWYLDKALGDHTIHLLFKTICIECGINVESRNISNHSGRRTSIMELFNIGVPENTSRAISRHKSSGGYYAYAKPTDKHKREALANILNKLINTTPSNEMAQDFTINTILFNETAQDSIEQINPESNDNKESQSIRSEDDELNDADLNNSSQVEQNEHEFYGKFHTAQEILNNSHKRVLKKEKQVIFKKNFPGPMNYELESLFPGVLGSEFGTVFGANSFEFLSGSVTLNSTMPGPVNSELCGSVDVELPPGHVELPPGPVNPEYTSIFPGCVNSKLCSFVDIELLPDLVPGSVNSKLCGSVDIELSPCFVNPEHNSTLSSSLDFELTEMDNNLPGLVSSGPVSNEGSGLDSSVIANVNQMIRYDTTELKLQVGDPFNDWDTVQCVVDAYSKQHGFVAIKCRKDLDPVNKSIIRCHDYACWKSGVNRPKKVEDIDVHCDGVSVDEYNHICDLNTIELAPKHLQFPPSILDRIENYTIVDVRIHNESDTATILQHLLNLKEQDQEYVVIPRIEGKSNELTGLFWMTRNFVEDFYHMRNSCTQDLFELKYQHMLTKYEPCRSYLETKLYSCCEAWARYAVLKVFTAGAESIQRVESINGVLKKHVNRAIDLVLAEYLTPIPLSFQRAQMNQSLLYQGILITIEQATDRAIEHLYDVSQIQLKEFLSGISNNEVEKIWEYVTISQGIKTYTSTLLYHIHQIRTANVYMPTIKECIDKKVQFGTTMSLAKTSVQIAVAEGVVAELVRVLTQFIMKYCRNTGLDIQETCSHCNIIEVSNPEYHKPRGHPPKRLKSYIEKDKENAKQHSNREQRTCSYCSGKGHNIRGYR